MHHRHSRLCTFSILAWCAEMCKQQARHAALETHLCCAVIQPLHHCIHHTLKITCKKVQHPLDGSERRPKPSTKPYRCVCWLPNELLPLSMQTSQPLQALRHPVFFMAWTLKSTQNRHLKSLM